MKMKKSSWVSEIQMMVDFYSGDKLLISTNARWMMKFEHLREKHETSETGEAVEAESELVGGKIRRPLGLEAKRADCDGYGFHLRWFW